MEKEYLLAEISWLNVDGFCAFLSEITLPLSIVQYLLAFIRLPVSFNF